MKYKTRWSLTYRMLECVQEQQAAICAVLAESRDRSIRSLLPENEEWVGFTECFEAILRWYNDY